jgi:integrase
MRRGEIFSLRWRDVDLEHGLINIQAFNTKTLRERQLSLTASKDALTPVFVRNGDQRLTGRKRISLDPSFAHGNRKQYRAAGRSMWIAWSLGVGCSR